MIINYEEVVTEMSGNKIIKRVNEDGSISFIPMDEANSDYQAYLDRDKPKAALSTPIVSSDAD
jgi:hypothetical protein